MQFIIDLILILIYAYIVIIICIWVWRFWTMYIRQKNIASNSKDSIMLEIKLPREINKSPQAMEPIIYSLLQSGGLSSWHNKFWAGNMPTTCSMEIASLEGVIHFYIRIHKKFRDVVTANIYAQYPGIEVIEADDYTKLIYYNHLSKNVGIWGASFKTTSSWKPNDPETGKPFKKGKEDVKMPADFFPIKTYVDYGLDKDPKEEYKHDPIVPLLEFMGSVSKGEYVWYQLLVQDEGVFEKKWAKTFVNPANGKRFTLVEMAKEYKNQLRKFKKIKKGDLAYDPFGHPIQRTIVNADGKASLEPVTYGSDKEMFERRESELTKEEKDEIEAVDKKTSKPLARTILRLIYLVDNTRGKFNGNHVQNVLGFLKPFNGANKFAPLPTSPYDFPWENIRGRRDPWRGEELFEAYVKREGFHPFTEEIKWLDKWEDSFFWNYTMGSRKFFRMMFDVLFKPFTVPEPTRVFVLNTEELATLYHFPGQVAAVPTLPRIDSTKSMAPSNLPQ